jgi:hypothetical protein
MNSAMIVLLFIALGVNCSFTLINDESISANVAEIVYLKSDIRDLENRTHSNEVASAFLYYCGGADQDLVRCYLEMNPNETQQLEFAQEIGDIRPLMLSLGLFERSNQSKQELLEGLVRRNRTW